MTILAMAYAHFSKQLRKADIWIIHIPRTRTDNNTVTKNIQYGFGWGVPARIAATFQT